jgi:hypothetical protein
MASLSLKHFSAITALHLSVCLISNVLERVPMSPAKLYYNLNFIGIVQSPSNLGGRDLRGGGGRIGSNGQLSHSKSFRRQGKKQQRSSDRDVRGMAPPIDDSDEQNGNQKKVRKKTGKLLRERLTWKNPHNFGKKLSLRQARSVRSELDIARTCQASLDRIEWIRQSAQPRSPRPAPRFVAQHLSSEANKSSESVLPQDASHMSVPARSSSKRFVPAPYFNGDVAGFEFRVGSRGSGYYTIRSHPSTIKHNHTRRVGTTAPDAGPQTLTASTEPPIQPTRSAAFMLGMEYGDEGSSELEERMLRGDEQRIGIPSFAVASRATSTFDGEVAAVASFEPAGSAVPNPAGGSNDALDRVRVAGTGQTLREWLRHAQAGALTEPTEVDRPKGVWIAS